MSTRHQSRAFHWCFTIILAEDGCPNCTCVGRWARFQAAHSKTGSASYYIMGLEVASTTGKHHIQGYVRFERQTLFTAAVHWAEHISFELEGRPPHVEMARQPVPAREYCKKEGSFFEWGSMPVSEQGRRTDLESALEDVVAGKRRRELITLHPGVFVRYWGNLHRVADVLGYKHPRIERELHVWFGPPGSGKTTTALSEYPEAWWFPESGASNTWWDGYMDEDVIIVDEFAPDHPWTIQKMNRLADPSPLRLQTKGGFVCLNHSKIIFLTNIDPMTWWSNDQTVGALHRRFHIRYFEIDLNK